MKYIVMSDIHGWSNKLNNALKELKKIENAQFVFLGDYIDRGPDSKGVIDLLINLKNELPETKILLGNHEEFLIGSLFNQKPSLKKLSQNEIFGIWMRNGGKSTFDQYKNNFPDSHINFFKSLDIIYETRNIIFVHAGINRNIPLKNNTIEDFLWIRPPFGLLYEMKRLVIHGHTPNLNVINDITENRICIDTKCSNELGKLTALVIDENNIDDYEIFEFQG